MKNVSRSLVYLWHYWPTALGTIVSLLLVTATNLVAPQLLRILIDDGIEALDLDTVFWVAAALVVVALVRGGFNFLQGYSWNYFFRKLI